MKRMALLSVVAVIGSPVFPLIGQENESPAAKTESEREVAALFESMREGTFSGRNMSWLEREHIPSLLDRAGSRRELREFPRNPISSQFESVCPEGMIALWLVEGIRMGDGKKFVYPSLNPLCMRVGKPRGRDWTEESKANQPDVAKAYRTWWSERGKKEAGDLFAVNPLEGTGLAWHGMARKRSGGASRSDRGLSAGE